MKNNLQLKIKNIHKKKYIYDIIRRKYVILTPEEYVRQVFLHYLIHTKNYPVSLIKVEKVIKLNKLTKRCDIVVFDNTAKPRVIIECKAPDIEITPKTFEQIVVYNMKLNVEYLVLTNGQKHYCCKIDQKKQQIRFLNYIPDYKELMP